MEFNSLISALARHRIAVVRSTRRTKHHVTWILEGYVITPPCGRRLVTYELTVQHPRERIPPDRIDAILRHFWQGQVDLEGLG